MKPLMLALLLWASAAFANEPLVLGPGDIVNIHVWGVDGSSQTATVASDGTLTLRHGPMKAGGLTLLQLHTELIQVYGAFVLVRVGEIQIPPSQNWRLGWSFHMMGRKVGPWPHEYMCNAFHATYKALFPRFRIEPCTWEGAKDSAHLRR